jgi:hypothetical protein
MTMAEPTDISKINKDDKALTKAARADNKKKTGDPAVDALVEATKELDKK